MRGMPLIRDLHASFYSFTAHLAIYSLIVAIFYLRSPFLDPFRAIP